MLDAGCSAETFATHFDSALKLHHHIQIHFVLEFSSRARLGRRVPPSFTRSQVPVRLSMVEVGKDGALFPDVDSGYIT